jgi:hypothetical protein
LEIIGDPYQTFGLITKVSSTPTVTGNLSLILTIIDNLSTIPTITNNLSSILTVTDNPRTDEKFAKPLE